MLTVRQECSPLIVIDVGIAIRAVTFGSNGKGVVGDGPGECGEWKTANKWGQ